MPFPIDSLIEKWPFKSSVSIFISKYLILFLVEWFDSIPKLYYDIGPEL